MNVHASIFGAVLLGSLTACANGEAPTPLQGRPEPTPGAAPHSASAEIEAMDLAGAEAALGRAEKELGDAIALATPDCDRARLLRDRVCELSGRICRLSEREPGSLPRCEDARRRCTSATTRIATQCS